MKKVVFSLLISCLFFYLILVNVKPVIATHLFNQWISENGILTHSIANTTALTLENNIYVLGGSNIDDVSDIYHFPLNSDGTLSSKIEDSNILTEGLYWSTVVKLNDFKFVKIGGADFSNGISTSNKVLVGNIELSGTLNFVSGPVLTEKLSLGSAVVVGDWVYYLGGATWPGPTLSDDIYVSHLDSEGNLGNWESTRDSANNIIKLPTFLAAHGTIVAGNKIFVFGGSTNSSFLPSNNVYVFESDPVTGKLTRLADEENLPFNSRSAMIAKVGDYVVHAGGVLSPGPATDKVYFAQIDGSGNIGSWELSSQSLPQINCCTAITVWGDYIYIIGGHDNQGPYYNSVIYSKINTSPEPIGKSLDVPDFKQTDPLWGGLEYNTASKWAPSNPSISRWGCAMTSASMILNYHGDNTNPQQLNDWLKANNGYTRNGGVLWPSISRYTLINSNTPTLEFSYHSYSDSLVKSEIDQNRPSILKLDNETYGGNHFVAAKGYENSDILINDPASNTNTKLSQANSFWGDTLKIGKFTPSETDLSYIVILVDGEYEIKVGTELGDITGSEFYHRELPMLDPENPNSDINLEALNAFYYPKPETRSYGVEINGEPGSFQIDLYVYDPEGNLFTKTVQGNIPAGQDSYNIIVDTNDILNPKITEYYFQQLLDYLNSHLSISKGPKKGYFNFLINHTLSANDNFLEGNYSVSINQLNNVIFQLKAARYLKIYSFTTIEAAVDEVEGLIGLVNSYNQ